MGGMPALLLDVEVAIGRGGAGQQWAGPKLARFFRAKILTAQPTLKTGSVGSNSLFKAKKNTGGPGHTEPGHTEPGQNWPCFFRANNLMAQPGPNSGRTGLAHRIRPILPHLIRLSHQCPIRPLHEVFRISYVFPGL